jgi:regulator of sirC expression with transglutaminase-like and TPR domain
MKDNELKALVSLLDDEDNDVVSHVERKIISLGDSIIPYLETEWENNFNPDVQKKIEDLIHTLQFDSLRARLIDWKHHESDNLLKGMLLVASYQYPDVDMDKIRKELEQIYYDAWLEFKPESHPYDQVKILNSVIFSKLKFGANTKNFHAPGNSMLNIVLETRKGNPISLCVVYMLVAQKLKMPIYGVNLPNLFILTYKGRDSQFYINAFNRGLIFSRTDIDNYIHHLNINSMEMFYEPCPNIDIVKRVLRNLIISFEKLNENAKVDEIKILLNSITDTNDPVF